jgi:hypothetical protein
MFAGKDDGEVLRVLDRLRSERLPFYSRADLIADEATTAAHLHRWVNLRKESPQ